MSIIKKKIIILIRNKITKEKVKILNGHYQDPLVGRNKINSLNRMLAKIEQ